MRIGCSTITFRNDSLERALDRIATLGMRVIDLGAVPGWCDHVSLTAPALRNAQQLAELVKRYGLEVAAVQAVPWHPDAIDDAAEIHQRYVAAVEAARAVNAGALLVDPGMGSDVGRAKGIDRFKRTIAIAAELALESGVRLAIEAPNHGTLAETLPQTLELLEQAAIPDLGVDLDTRHLLASDASSSDVLDALADRIVHVACRDGVRGAPESCTPGDGQFDFAEFFHLLRAAGYEEAITLELIPSNADMHPDDRTRETARARDYIETLIAEAGLN
jgi:sugar phosphate isomerase/epimerase